MKIVSTGRTISTTEYLAKKVKARRKRLWIACGAFLVLIIMTLFALRMKSLQIAEVKVEGAAGVAPSQVEEAAREFVAGSYLWLVPKTNVFFYPRAGLERELLRRFPRMSSAAASLEGLHILRVSAGERKPYALYCGEECYFMDDTGFIFDTAPQFSDGVYLAYSSDAPLESPLGKQFVPEAEFRGLSAFAERLEALGAEPRSLRFSGTEGRVSLAGRGAILFARGADMGSLASGLESFLASEPIRAEGNFWQKLATLDMRTENKVFYSFK
ncbi:hypothetical protein KW784_01670 [Candidatus Parcubacteria bacterium]|nr:hypothetical protein [Candidatus Parcubacteria bacterium]